MLRGSLDISGNIDLRYIGLEGEGTMDLSFSVLPQTEHPFGFALSQDVGNSDGTLLQSESQKNFENGDILSAIASATARLKDLGPSKAFEDPAALLQAGARAAEAVAADAGPLEVSAGLAMSVCLNCCG